MNQTKPVLLFISHVVPQKCASGQEQRVLQMLLEARKHFRTLFLTFGNQVEPKEIYQSLEKKVDRVIVIPSKYSSRGFNQSWFTSKSLIYRWRTGLKKSNYIIGEVEFTAERIGRALKDEKIDLVIYEYWHAWKSSKYFSEQGIPVILDMHDILSNAYRGQLERNSWMPAIIKQRLSKLYTLEEYRAWMQFDGIIAINQLELYEVDKQVHNKKLYFCPMGIDLEYWNYSYNPSLPVRFGFYGGLGSSLNQRQALFTSRQIMPMVWKELPDAELWLVGSNPSPELKTFNREDSRIHTTGFLADPRPTLASLTGLFCPWEGVFGFRSRLVEVMALGVPVIASPDAFAGMGLEVDLGILKANNDEEFAHKASQLAVNHKYAKQQSLLARNQVEELFSIENTYGKLFKELRSCFEPELNIY